MEAGPSNQQTSRPRPRPFANKSTTFNTQAQQQQQQSAPASSFGNLRMLHLQLRRQPLAPLPTPKALLLRLRSISLRLRSLPHRRRALLVRARRRSDPTTPMLLPQRQLSAAARHPVQPQPSGRVAVLSVWQRTEWIYFDVRLREKSGQLSVCRFNILSTSSASAAPSASSVPTTHPASNTPSAPSAAPTSSFSNFLRKDRTGNSTPDAAQDHPTTTSQQTKTRCARSGSKTLPKSVTVSSR